jgi:hypothetical protein
MADARFTLVSAYDGPVHFNVKFCSGLRDRPASPSANLPARGHAVQSPASNAIVGAELGRWPRRRRTRARARRSSMIAPAMRLRSMRSSGLRFDGIDFIRVAK